MNIASTRKQFTGDADVALNHFRWGATAGVIWLALTLAGLSGVWAQLGLEQPSPGGERPTGPKPKPTNPPLVHEAPVLTPLPPVVRDWFRIGAEGLEESHHRLWRSQDLKDWNEAGRFHGPFDYSVPEGFVSPAEFFRVEARPLTGEDDWKNQIDVQFDPFLATAHGFSPENPSWIKFAILRDREDRVYFQDSKRYVFHYDFATKRLQDFQGMDRTAFEQAALFPESQQIVLGTVLIEPDARATPRQGNPEVGVQLVGLTPYPKEAVVDYIHLVDAALRAATDGPLTVFYMPTFEQASSATEHREYFREHGIEMASVDRWASSDQCYAPGWAVGRLVMVEGQRIDEAFRAGELTPHDILVTDAVPAEIPPLAGVITLSPSTPNSHVALLAHSFGVPFVYLISEARRDDVLQRVGQEILLRADDSFEACRVTIKTIDGDITPEFRDALRQLRLPPELDIAVKEPYGALFESTENLEPSDIRHFGGKAANYGVLRDAIPDHSRPAVAFSFDLWDQFMAQPVQIGEAGVAPTPLASFIQETLAPHSWPPDIAALQDDLQRIRETITDQARFTEAQKAVIVSALQCFDASQKIRFRSSTNVEDSRQFSGAGLYDSFSGCLQDDLDADDQGPSHCDPDRNGERGVLRAIRKVYASFYNDNAVLERLRHRIDEAQVAMGVLAHHSFPDETELANGVATGNLRVTSFRPGDSSASLTAKLTTQVGANSVANPDGLARPETVEYSRFGNSAFVSQKQLSSLLPLGGTVMTWEADYRTLGNLMVQAGLSYLTHFPGSDEAWLNFEYKRIAPDGLVIKQIREVPSPHQIPAPERVAVLSTASEIAVFQGEFGDVFANHRLKSFWTLHAANAFLEAGVSPDDVLVTIQLNRLNRLGGKVPFEGTPSSLPEFRGDGDDSSITLHWRTESGGATLVGDFQMARELVRKPVLTLDDLWFTYEMDYDQPVVGTDFDGTPIMRNSDTVFLRPVMPVTERSLPQHRVLANGSGVTIETRFFWPEPPSGIVAGYTAPLIAWVETRITGLTSQPIVLTDPFAQTYRPGHHNFGEDFLFEPRLDPSVPAATVAELEAKGITRILAVHSFDQATLTLLDSNYQPVGGN